MNNVFVKYNLEKTNGYMSATFIQLSRGGFVQKYINGDIDYLPFIPNPDKDLNVISMFNNRITSDYRTEYNCELHRSKKFPILPSRLSAIYAFGDYQTCKIVSEKYHWPLDTVRKFKIEDIPLTRIVKVNMEIISLARYANRISMISQETDDEIWQAYWSGSSEFSMELPTINGRKVFNSGTIWEYLIDGSLYLDI